MADDPNEIYDRFRGDVNLAPAELEKWLATDESRAVGDSDETESTGHRSGRRSWRSFEPGKPS